MALPLPLALSQPPRFDTCESIVASIPWAIPVPDGTEATLEFAIHKPGFYCAISEYKPPIQQHQQHQHLSGDSRNAGDMSVGGGGGGGIERWFAQTVKTCDMIIQQGEQQSTHVGTYVSLRRFDADGDTFSHAMHRMGSASTAAVAAASATATTTTISTAVVSSHAWNEQHAKITPVTGARHVKGTTKKSQSKHGSGGGGSGSTALGPVSSVEMYPSIKLPVKLKYHYVRFICGPFLFREACDAFCAHLCTDQTWKSRSHASIDDMRALVHRCLPAECLLYDM